MKKKFDYSKIIFSIIYMTLLFSSGYIFFKSYKHYQYLHTSPEYQSYITQVQSIESINKVFFTGDVSSRTNEQLTIMLISLIVLSVSLLMLFRLGYMLKSMRLKKKNLATLLDDMENYPNKEKVNEFKKILHNRESAEIYAFMSEMIEDLEESKELADRANETKSLFLANMSHELRTPLNGIVGFTKFLKSTELNHEQDEFVQIIRKSSEDLLSIINDILDISKIENGHIQLEEVFFNPMETFENVIESYAANASKKDIDFSLWIDPKFSSALLRSDPVKIKQVLFNLISNAVKFTDKQGAINIMIEKVASKGDEVSIRFSVKDTGIGISKEQESKVFEAFSQADSSTSRKYGGTGLGLTISSSLVTALGGALSVESTLGKGSTFFFTLTLVTQNIQREKKIQPIKMAIYAPLEVQSKDSDHYLEDYLLSYKHLSLIRFKTFEECMDAPKSLFDVLYIHYDKINPRELHKIVSIHASHASIILVVKLNRRDEVQKLDLNFAQVLYEPITFSKVEKSFNFFTNKEDEYLEVEVVSPKEVKFNNLHSLVVEDNPINQKMIEHTLKNMGISSECANNGQEGFDRYMENSKNYDVIFMDIQMPVLNGIDATKKILAYEKEHDLRHTPIIAVTANALKGDRERFLDEGMDEYVSKPIDLEKFISALKIFFPINKKLELVPKTKRKDILLYKQTTMEAKIISAILNKLDYSVDIAENIDELKKIIDVNSYKCILLDRTKDELIHNSLTQKIKDKNIPSLLFVDTKNGIDFSDKENYTFVSNNITDYISIKEKVDYMIALEGEAS
jgi:signal transduction histidine kinase/CheY-like chemotaxis protein